MVELKRAVSWPRQDYVQRRTREERLYHEFLLYSCLGELILRGRARDQNNTVARVVHNTSISWFGTYCTFSSSLPRQSHAVIFAHNGLWDVARELTVFRWPLITGQRKDRVEGRRRVRSTNLRKRIYGSGFLFSVI